MKRIKMIAIVVYILVFLSFLSFTYISAIKEPKRPVPKIFSYITRNHQSPSPPFSKSFSLYGINRTFQFRAYVAYRTFFKPYCGYPITTVWVNVTETNQKTPFGLGSMSILVDKVNLTESYGAHLLFITDKISPKFHIRAALLSHMPPFQILRISRVLAHSFRVSLLGITH